ncbi:hypothetical protein BT96DRAFT_949454 [Gymnopus androsaceus JB14]|uniref:3'-5' exonuclease domain-containing protein n=1 Tax=Gymnopus androsaceus JB14 TaxID=1447944 RepID=A0A6A4GJS9_9AGAR|nr:hypothetical protein BT96DRAFT_949454 [Gymnopus androsaceus JB14]
MKSLELSAEHQPSDDNGSTSGSSAPVAVTLDLQPGPAKSSSTAQPDHVFVDLSEEDEEQIAVDETAAAFQGGIGRPDAIIEDDDVLPHARTQEPIDYKKTPFMSHFLKLQAESSQHINKLPTLFQNQSFWFPQEALWFCLKKANLTPQDCYDLDFFLWDPECLLPDGIQNSSSDPWPQSAFQSWDEHIINQLPKPLAAEFPNGMGAKQFSNSLLIQHLEGYDELQLAYLQTAATKPARNAVTGEPLPKFIPFPPFHDRSQDGFHGYIPSSQWLCDIFDSFIENHTAAFNQHMAIFKLAKHIAKVNGVPVFTALLTVTNEKGEIRICNLVATKSHSQFELALQRMRDSLQLYGHDQPSLFYTDNMSDKAFLEHSFPSLTADVVPVEKYAHLDLLKIPDTVNISVRNSIETIDTAMCTILSFLPDDDSMETIIVGFDAEWNVEISERGYITGRGQTAIIQIAHQQNVYILQIGEMLARGSLPPVLKELLQNPQIIKVGCHVSADLKYIEQSLHSACHFSGSLDLAQYAKDRQAIKSARCGLSDLVATVLGKQLQKNVSEWWCIKNFQKSPYQHH